ncbi:hypothetical protein RRG08_023371 [Elysia crispata]|uniref:Uncharacterized protein n=1 Tax=Elysia crispata TaxID=231223 RepID=A0AAE1EDM9_9GAST|nr:hypothetical protein RRG08_023371 [Elysia crispata]
MRNFTRSIDHQHRSLQTRGESQLHLEEEKRDRGILVHAHPVLPSPRLPAGSPPRPTPLPSFPAASPVYQPLTALPPAPYTFNFLFICINVNPPHQIWTCVRILVYPSLVWNSSPSRQRFASRWTCSDLGRALHFSEKTVQLSV